MTVTIPTLCTVITKNKISYARTLVQSFLQHHPSATAYVLLADGNEGLLPQQEVLFEWIDIKDLGLPVWPDLRFCYRPEELCAIIKPFLLSYLFAYKGLDKVVYFDPEIFILQRMDAFFRELSEANIVLTPKLSRSDSDKEHSFGEPHCNETQLFNLGFITLTKSKETMHILDCWKTNIRSNCLLDFPFKSSNEHKWVNLLPVLFEKVHVCKDPAFTTAYWNLHEPPLVYKNGRYESNAEPISFYNFQSGDCTFSSVSLHSTQHNGSDEPAWQSLYQMYQTHLMDNEFEQTKDLPFAYLFFDNGTVIPDIARRIYLKMGPSLAERGDPFHTSSPDSFYQLLFSPCLDDKQLPFLLQHVYAERNDLKKIFPASLGADRKRLLTWSKHNLPAEYGINPTLWKKVLNSHGHNCNGRAKK